MSETINVTVHASQFPECVKETLLAGLRSRRIAPKFHYQSYNQAQLWLALHRACSPAWLDPEGAAIYDRSYAAAAGLVPQRRVSVAGLGCGGGYKEAQLLRWLAAQGKEPSYVPCDVSLPLVLASVREAQNVMRPSFVVGTPRRGVRSAQQPAERASLVKFRFADPTFPAVSCRPLVCDLALAPDLPEILNQLAPADARRIITFFGLIPNFEPDLILPKLAALVRPEDLLLFSANLAPGPDYRAGVQRVLPGYDNRETRAWLRAFLEDLGAEPGDGAVDFSIEEAAALLRIVADFRFLRERELVVHNEHFAFHPGDSIRLFFSYRHTPDLVRQLLQAHHLQVIEQWITKSEEEGVFLCRKIAGDCAAMP
jgi:L-histidine Nalpha-methyltransferase